MEELLKKTSAKISNNLKQALSKIEHGTTADDIKAAKCFLSEANYQIGEYDKLAGNNGDASKDAKSLSSKLALEIARLPSEQKNYA